MEQEKVIDELELKSFEENLALKGIMYKNRSATRGKQVVGVPMKVNKVNRNDPCPCGSGKKFKKCCGKEDSYTVDKNVLIEQKKQELEQRRRQEEEDRQLKEFLVTENITRKGDKGLLLSTEEAEYLLDKKELFHQHFMADFKIINQFNQEQHVGKLDSGTYQLVFLTDDTTERTISNDAVILILEQFHTEKVDESASTPDAEVVEGELIK